MDLHRPAERLWRVAHGRTIELGARSTIMGVLNVTPDSFSDGGLYDGDPGAALARARRLIEEGAAIVDVGGESTRPGAAPVSGDEERARVLPVIEALAATGAIVSVDTYRSQTARLAIAAGAHIVNDVWGAQKDEAIAAVAAETGAGLCLMHTGRERRTLDDVIEDQVAFLSRSIEIALGAGVERDRIVLDPGFGFAKDLSENVELLARMDEILGLGYPILVGTSRKRFVRALGGEAGRDVATAATSVLLRERGAAIFRVHDVATNRAALGIADALVARGTRP